MFQKGFVIVFYQVKSSVFFVWHRMSAYQSQNLPEGFSRPQLKTSKDIPFVFWTAQYLFSNKFGFLFGSMPKGGFYDKNTQGFYLQPMKLSGATTLGCIVVFCDCLCPTGCEYWTSTRAIEVQWGKKRSRASTVFRVELEDVVFVISGSGKRVLPVLPRAYSEWQLLMLHEKSTCSTIIRMVLR